MEEIFGIPQRECDYNKETTDFDSVGIPEPFGVVVKIDNPCSFALNFEQPKERKIFEQLLSQEVAKQYWKKKTFPRFATIPYKDEGFILFRFAAVTRGDMYAGYVYICHYDYQTTVS